MANKIAPAAYSRIPTLETGQSITLAVSSIIVALGSLLGLFVGQIAFVCRASMRIWRSGKLHWLDMVDHFWLRRTWVLVQRELESRGGLDTLKPSRDKNGESPIYKVIKPDGNNKHFRILTILPGVDPLVECSLDVLPLTDTIEDSYEAISYRWRFSAWLPTFPILVNGHILEVQSNVYRLLRDLRRQDQKRAIWIDSICIDQETRADKTVQLPLMHLIYSKASRVVSWFADSRTGTGGITALKHVISQGPLTDSDVWFIINAPFSFQLLRWIKIVELLRHEYFRRMWMIQEVALSKKLTMIHGHEEIDWEEFAAILPSLHGPEGERFLREPDFLGRFYLDERVIYGIKGALGMHVAKDLLTRDEIPDEILWQMPEPVRLVIARINTRLSGRRVRQLPLSAYGALAQLLSLPDMQSTVPEDKIYGIGGLLVESALILDARTTNGQLDDEYGKDVSTTSKILRNFACKVLCDDPHPTFPPHFHMAGWGYKELAEPISSNEWTDKTPQYLCLPSWVPNVHQARLKSTFIDSGGYLAGTSERKRVARVRGSPDLIKISASHLTTIASVTPTAFILPDPRDLESCYRGIRTFLDEAKQLTGISPIHDPLYRETVRQSPYPRPREALLRTIFSDTVAGSLPPLDVPTLADLKTALEALLNSTNGGTTNWSPSSLPHRIVFELARSLGYHRFCVTSSGHFGLVPMGCRPGDEIFMVWGAQTPFVVRKVEEEEKIRLIKGDCDEEDYQEDQWTMMGSCFLYGYMNGEASRRTLGDGDILVR
ncbi:Heterokaryon incompatibility protein (HET) domain containing protein [Naviculisporaceae sp. PSN 640]